MYVRDDDELVQFGGFCCTITAIKPLWVSEGGERTQTEMPPTKTTEHCQVTGTLPTTELEETKARQ